MKYKKKAYQTPAIQVHTFAVKHLICASVRAYSNSGIEYGGEGDEEEAR